MKKSWILFLVLLLLLPSCTQKAATEPEEVYFVASVGVDKSEDGILLSLEIPMVREKDPGNIEKRVFCFFANDFAEAMKRADKELSKLPNYDHCALLAFGETLEKKKVKSILSQLGQGGILPLATQAIFTPNAKELLEADSLSALTAGYEIAGLLKENSNIQSHSKIYELAQSKNFLMPYILINQTAEGESFIYHQNRMLGEDAS